MSADRRFFCIVWLVTWLTLWVGFAIAGMNSVEAIFAAFPVGWTAAILLTPYRERLARVTARVIAHPFVRYSCLCGFYVINAARQVERGLEKGDTWRVVMGGGLLLLFVLGSGVAAFTMWKQKARRPPHRSRRLMWLL
jgi:hypothetical protein